MDIGQKIKQVRLSRGLTQTELCSGVVTRNMLSLIENGSASPSVGTLVKLAEKLDIPAGYLLSDAENDRENEYIRMHLIGNVRSAFKNENYKECVNLCESLISEPDDELSLILSESHLKIAVGCYEEGLFTSASASISKAQSSALQTIYDTSHIERACVILTHLIRTIEADPDTPPPPQPASNLDTVAAYLNCNHLISQNKLDEAMSIANEVLPSPLRDHAKIKTLVINSDYEQALTLLQSLVSTHAQTLTPYTLYKIYTDIELCCKQTSNFKTAYEYSTKKLEIIKKTKR